MKRTSLNSSFFDMQFAEIRYSFPSKQVELSCGIFVNYIDLGRGDEVLLFVHGLGSNISGWAKNVEILKNHFRCIAIDLPGYARSKAGIFIGTMDFYAEILAEFMKKLGLVRNRVNLVGHSMGGQISITTALKYSELIKRLVLVAPAGFETFSEEEVNWLKKYFTVETIELSDENQIRSNFLRNFYIMPIDAETMINDRIEIISSKNFLNYCRVVVNSFYGMLDKPVYYDLEKINCKTIIFFGMNDLLIPHPFLHKDMTSEQIAKAGASKIRGSKIVLIDNCGHFLQYEKPEEFNKEIVSFIRS